MSKFPFKTNDSGKNMSESDKNLKALWDLYVYNKKSNKEIYKLMEERIKLQKEIIEIQEKHIENLKKENNADLNFFMWIENKPENRLN